MLWQSVWMICHSVNFIFIMKSAYFSAQHSIYIMCDKKNSIFSWTQCSVARNNWMLLCDYCSSSRSLRMPYTLNISGLSSYPGYFPAPHFNEAPGNIQGNLDRYDILHQYFRNGKWRYLYWIILFRLVCGFIYIDSSMPVDTVDVSQPLTLMSTYTGKPTIFMNIFLKC